MSEAILSEPVRPADQPRQSAAPTPAQSCDDCLGSGGWFRYEPALEPAPGVLYLSCVRCRGTGRTAQARD